MAATAKTYLPTEEELTVPELNLSSPVLQASAFYVGKACEKANNEYLLCTYELKDPRKCLQEGKDVTSCAFDFFRKLKKHCHEDFLQYADCLRNSSGTLDFKLKTQAVLDKCVLENLNIERPPFGYFCEARIHDTSRPRPPPPEIPRYPDATPGLPDDTPLVAGKHPDVGPFA